MLNDTYIRTLKANEKDQKHFDGGGLYLFIPKSGSKLWRLAYRFDGKTKMLCLGKYPLISLKEARERREDAKRLLSRGLDPGAHKKQIQQEKLVKIRDSFRNIALEWHADQTASFTDKHRNTIMFRLENYLFPTLGDMHIVKLEARDILAVVKPIEHQGQLETARRLMQLTGQVFRYAVATGRARHNIVADMRGALRPRQVTHRAAITDPRKVGQLLQDIEEYDGYFPLCCALRLAPLVFVRPTELRAARWSEFDLDAGEWRIPPARMKMRQQHIVPLSRQALDILKELLPYSGGCEYLFPSIRSDCRPISDATMLSALRRMGYEKHEMSTHGFRSLASTLLNEQGYNRDWIERQLAHGERNEVRAAYNYAEYLPERRKMMQDWSDYLDRLKRQ